MSNSLQPHGKYIGRGILTEFFRKQGIQEISSLFEKYELENFFDEMVYFRMLCELQKNTNDQNFYWKNKGYSDPADLSEFFKQLLKKYNNSDNPRSEEDEFKKIYEHLVTWYKILGNNNKAELLEKYLKLAEVEKLSILNIMLGLISLYDPNMKIKIDNFEFNNICHCPLCYPNSQIYSDLEQECHELTSEGFHSVSK